MKLYSKHYVLCPDTQKASGIKYAEVDVMFLRTHESAPTAPVIMEASFEYKEFEMDPNSSGLRGTCRSKSTSEGLGAAKKGRPSAFLLAFLATDPS